MYFRLGYLTMLQPTICLQLLDHPHPANIYYRLTPLVAKDRSDIMFIYINYNTQ